jgi:hypothetical protein
VVDLLGPAASADAGAARAIFTSGGAPQGVLVRFGIRPADATA